MKIPMKISVAKSDYFMNRAWDACLSLPPNVAGDITNKSQSNYFSPVFLDAYIMSVIALEAFINERIAINLQILNNRIAMKLAEPEEVNHRKILELLKEQDLITKYRMMPVLLWDKAFNESRSPFQDFVSLVSIRNDIIHYKMPFYDEQRLRPKWARKLEEKHILLSQPVVHEQYRVWIDEICTLKGVKWAYNTSCRMMKQFAKLAEGIIRTTCQDYVNSFKEL